MGASSAIRVVARSRVALVILVVTLCGAGFLALARQYGFTRIAGRPYWLPDDDFMISQRYARSLARGDGLVFNRDERVEGFSNPLTVLAISLPLELLDVDRSRLGLYVCAINAIPHVLIVLLLLSGRRGGPDACGLGAAVVYLTLPHHGFFAHAGLEVYLQAACLLAVSIGIERRAGAAFYPAMVLLPLVHPADIPTWVGAGILRLYQERRRWRRELLYLLATAVPFIGYVVFRSVYYGELVPNTYLLKASGTFLLRRGLRYVWEGAAVLSPALTLLVLGLSRRDRRARSLPAMLVLFGPYVLSVIKIGGDTIPSYRMIFVVIPALLFFAAESLRGTSGRLRQGILVGGLAAQLAMTAAAWPAAQRAHWQALEWERNRTILGLAIAANTSPDQKIALFGLGLAGYYGDRPTIDMLGKADRHIARTPPKLWRQVAHQKSDPDYVLRRRPDFIEMPYDRRQVQDGSFLRQESRGRYGYGAELALEPSFLATYVPVGRDRTLPLWRRRDLPERPWAMPTPAINPATRPLETPPS
jgi:arabinofuranosyltransferase